MPPRPQQFTDAPTLALKELLDLIELQKLGQRAKAPERTAARYIDDPLGWIDNCVNFPVQRRKGKATRPPGLAEYQREIMASLPIKLRVAVRGPRGLGKSTLASLVILWFATTRDAAGIDWKIVTTAGSWQQLTDFLWKEIKKWAYCLNWEAIGRGPFSERNELMKTGLSLRHGLATAGSPDQPQKLEGAHADSVLYVFDESKLISADTFDAAEGAFSGAGEDTGLEAFALAISTPGEPAGRFYDMHRHAEGLEDWHTYHVTLEQAVAAGRMLKSWAAQRAKLWGVTSALYQNHVLGEFCADDEDAVIPLAWLEAAFERWRTWDAAGRPDDGGVHTCGVDVARSGKDKSVAAIRYGNVISHILTWTREDTMETVGRVKGILDADPLCTAIIDVIGIGAGVYDRCREMGLKVDPFNAAKKTTRRDTTRQFGFLNCLTGDARVRPVGGLRRIYRSRYEGSLFKIETARGDSFTATPNHNVLTPQGWVPVQSLRVGDQLRHTSVRDAPRAAVRPEVDHVPPQLSEVYRAGYVLFGSERVQPGTVNFHGDRPVGEVDVVTIDRDLLTVDPACREKFAEIQLFRALHCQGALLGESLLLQPLRAANGDARVRPPFPDDCVARCPREPLSGREPFMGQVVGFFDGAPCDAVLVKDPGDAPLGDTIEVTKTLDGFAGQVPSDDLGFVVRDHALEPCGVGLAARLDAVLSEDAPYHVGVDTKRLPERMHGLTGVVAADEFGRVDGPHDGELHSLNATPGLDSMLCEDAVNGGPVGVVPLAERHHGLAVQVPLDEVSRIEVTASSLHGDAPFYVYTLETETGAYATSSIVHRNCRAAAYWHVREELNPARPGGATLAICPDDELAGDLTALHYKHLSEGKIQVESKDDIRKRIGRSTDKGDGVSEALFTLAGSFHDIYGTEMCPSEKCGRGFARNVDGKPRDRCPYCNAPLETEEDEAA